MTRSSPFLVLTLLGVVAFGGCTVGTIGEYYLEDVGSGGGGTGTDCVAEICDGLDNNCDGVVDEGCSCDAGESQDCYPGPPPTLGIGRCAQGTQTCDGGTWSDCQGATLPTDETCDGYDEDCDGFVDEDCPCEDGQSKECYNGNPITAGVGACKRGTQVCVNGSWGLCEGSITPSPEQCTGEDDDCDGTTDIDMDPVPATGGEDCASAIDLGELRDADQHQQTIDGNAPLARRETWWTFLATDDADTNGDEFHVDIRFMVNPGDGYVMDVYRGSCGAGDLLHQDEPSTVDWYTDFNQTSNGCGGPAPCGEGNCRTNPGEGECECGDDSSQFYVRIRPADAQPTCEAYTLEVSNGVR